MIENRSTRVKKWGPEPTHKLLFMEQCVRTAWEHGVPIFINLKIYESEKNAQDDRA